MTIETQIDPHSNEFRESRTDLEARISEFRSIETLVRSKSEEARAKLAGSSKLLPRERLDSLLDPEAPFLEIASLAGYKMHDDEDGSFAGGGLVSGVGFVSGVRCLVIVNNYTVKGGTISPTGLRKILRLHEIALANRLPLITLAESGGANLNYAAEVYIDGARAFANQARLSAAGIPQITVVHGNATAGGAYQPGLSDVIVLIEGQSKMFLAGPPLVKAATGEVATDEELGGAAMHSRTSGTAEYLARNDAEAIGIARKAVANLGWNEPLNVLGLRKRSNWIDPLYPADELLGVIPTNSKKPYDMREVVARLVDGSEFDEFKSELDSQTVCGRGHVFGRVCGFVGNNGPITAKGAGKAAQFIGLCEQTRTPVVFLHNTTGFMVGTEAEHSGIIRQGAKMIQAVANATVPKISFVIGGSFGAGNYAMCGRGFDPRFIFSWPNARTAVMGGEQAGKVLRLIAEEKTRKSGQTIDDTKMSALEAKTAEQLDKSSTALFSTAHLWDDGLIDPRDTRKVLGFVLDTCEEAEARRLQSISFGVPRH
ncbi:MAG: carboxyl transferase domain-containing protein [Bdellovibrionota bacterium]